MISMIGNVLTGALGLVGDILQGQWSVTQSKSALAELMQFLGGEEHQLVIERF